MRKTLLLVFSSFVFLLLILSSWLTSSQSGLNAVVRLSEKFVPSLEISEAKGRLIGPLTAKKIRYLPEASTGAEIEQFYFDWQPSALLSARLQIDDLSLTGMLIHAYTSEETEETATDLPDISLPLDVTINSLQVRDAVMRADDGNDTVLLENFETALNIKGHQLNVSTLSLDTADVLVALSGGLDLQPPYQTEFNYEFTLKRLLEQPLPGAGSIQGNTKRLLIEQEISSPLVSKQQMEIRDLLEQLQWSLVADSELVDLALLLPEQTTRLEALNLNASGTSESVAAKLNTTVIQDGLPPLTVLADVDSTDFTVWQLKLTSGITEEQRLDITGNIDTSTDQPSLDVVTTWRNLGWPLADDTAQLISPHGEVKLRGTPTDYEAKLTGQIDWQGESLNVDMTSRGTDTALMIESLQIQGFEGALGATGNVSWLTTTLEYQFNANWQGIQLPAALAGKAIQLSRGYINLDGNPQQLSLDTQAKLTLDDVEASLVATGKGQTDRGFDDAVLKIQLAEGSVGYSGPLLWQGETLLNGPLTLNNINPGTLVPDWPGKLSGTTMFSLSLVNDSAQFEAKAIAINGQLRERPVELTGAVNYSDAAIDITNLNLRSGKSTLFASGQLKNEQLNFNWSLASPDLQDFYPDLAGVVDAKGQLAGTIKAPAIQADITAKKLGYLDYKATRLESQIDLTLAEQSNINATVVVSTLQSSQLDAEKLELRIAGQEQSHDVQVLLNSEPINLLVDAKGSLSDDNVWRGELERFDFDNEQAGQWHLTKKGQIEAGSNAQQLPEHCWSATNGEICLEATHADGQWSAAGHFAQLPLSLFSGLVVELEQFTGALRGDFNLSSDEVSTVRGKGEIFVDDATLQLSQSALNQQKPVALNNVSLRYLIDENQTSADFYLEPALDGVSAIQAKVDTMAINDLIEHPEQAALRGQVTTAVEDLSALQLTHPAFADLKGNLAINLELGGTVKQPEINGTASLNQGEIALIDAGIILKEIQANVDGNLDKVDFDLQARSGEGVLTGEGQFVLTEDSWKLNTALKASQLEVMNTPEALVIAEPDLTISMTPKLTEVKGKVHIPEAELEPTQFNSAVSPSRDVIVISEQSQDETGATTKIDLTVSLGDKVKLKAMGFQGRLNGELRVFGKTSDILLGNGEILIKDGTYLAYGQLLHVDDGSIRFAGGAIDNPELSIKAVRKGKDYQAGLHIQGFAAAPQATLFSQPDMSQDDILSYILLGKPVQQASATDAALLASAATGMGLQNGAMIGDQIASTFGLDEFSIGGDSAENAALQVGKYLSPKLYVSYGIGVFESVSTVELRYELSKIWALKAESGTESGVDLLYTYERGKPEPKQ